MFWQLCQLVCIECPLISVMTCRLWFRLSFLKLQYWKYWLSSENSCDWMDISNFFELQINFFELHNYAICTLSCNTCPISSIPVCSVEPKLSEFTGHVLEVRCPNPRCRGTFSADADNSDLALCISLLSADAARNTSCYELVMNRSRNAVRLIF